MDKDPLFQIIDRILEGELCSVDAHIELLHWRDEWCKNHKNLLTIEETYWLLRNFTTDVEASKAINKVFDSRTPKEEK